MNTVFWFSFTLTCGIVVGKGLPKLLEWLLNRYEKKLIKEYEDANKESEDTE